MQMTFRRFESAFRVSTEKVAVFCKCHFEYHPTHSESCCCCWGGGHSEWACRSVGEQSEGMKWSSNQTVKECWDDVRLLKTRPTPNGSRVGRRPEPGGSLSLHAIYAQHSLHSFPRFDCKWFIGTQKRTQRRCTRVL